MLRWIITRFSAFTVRAYERKIERLTQKSRAFNAELEVLDGGKLIVLSEEDRIRLRKAREGIDPERLKQICVFDIDEPKADDARSDST